MLLFSYRWMAPDKLSEKYYDINPYVYCAGNPVNLVDPEGAWVWIAVGAGIEYGTQVYHNYQNGDSGYDAWFGNVNIVRVFLSAANPGKKFTLAKTVIIEGVKASISFTPNGGLSVNSDAKDVAKETTMNTVTSQVIGKLLNATSQEAVESTAKEASKAGKALNSAVHKASHRPNSTKAANALKKAEQTAVVSSKHAAGIKALNQTVGASPEATQYTIELFIKINDNDEKRQ